MAELPSGTVTFLFTDIEGSTRLLQELGAETYAAKLAEHRGVVRKACSTRGGVEVDTQGDAFFIAFPTAPGALEAARSITEELAAGPITLRIGLHTGTPLLTHEGYVGEEVHFAARVAASAHGGQIVLSDATRAHLDDRHALVELGEHRLKDIPKAVPIYQLGNESFPPLKTISNTNLPRPASSFVGRQRELQELLERIDSGLRLVTLSGPGGSGKTRLALEAAATLVPEYKAGVFWVGLAALRDATLVTETIGQTLGAKAGLADHIGGRQMLLLLDNLEQVIEVAPELTALLASCPNLSLLVTSRELLRVQGELEYPVPPLAGAEAVSLFCERAQTGASEEIAELCLRLDNLPLAVELAAARAKALSPTQLLDRLSQRLDLLKGGRDAHPRQQTLRATIAWSYELLSAAEQRLFRRLSVFAGGCTLEAAEEVAGADLDTLWSLVEKSLVRFSNERYWMLETIREFAVEQLEGSGEANELNERSSHYFLSLAVDVGPHLKEPNPDLWLQRLDAEHPNLRATIGWADRSRNEGLKLGLVLALWDFWFLRSHLDEGASHCAAALKLPGLTSEQRLLLLGGVAVFACERGRFTEAKSSLEERLALARKVSDKRRVVDSLRVLGTTQADLGDIVEARELLEQSVALAADLPEEDARVRMLAIADLGYVLLINNEYASAIDTYEEALHLLREVGDLRGVSVSLENIAIAKLRSGQPDEATACLREALTIAHRIGNPQCIVNALAVLAAVTAGKHYARRAAVTLGAEDALCRAVGYARQRLEQDLWDEAVAIARDDLGDEEFESAFAAGSALDTEAAVMHALREGDPDA